MFSRHFVKDREMRNVLTDTFKVSASRYARKSKYITDKDILIIDDTIGNGQTIKSACQVMMESYIFNHKFKVDNSVKLFFL